MWLLRVSGLVHQHRVPLIQNPEGVCVLYVPGLCLCVLYVPVVCGCASACHVCACFVCVYAARVFTFMMLLCVWESVACVAV